MHKSICASTFSKCLTRRDLKDLESIWSLEPLCINFYSKNILESLTLIQLSFYTEEKTSVGYNTFLLSNSLSYRQGELISPFHCLTPRLISCCVGELGLSFHVLFSWGTREDKQVENGLLPSSDINTYIAHVELLKKPHFPFPLLTWCDDGF